MEEQAKTKCPLCGSDAYIEKPLDENVKDAFLESILGDVPFIRTYDVMGGRIAITVKALSDEDNRVRSSFFIKLFDATEKCAELKAYIPLIESALDIDGQILEAVITVGGTSKKVTRNPSEGLRAAINMDWENINNDNCKEFVDAALEVFSNTMFAGCNIPTPILRSVVVKHNTLLGRLMRECIDKNFIEGTGR